ncbi:MAG: OsmC family protein [Hyphomicrobiales bacterium]
MARSHSYAATVEWTGNRGGGTADYKAFGRDYTISAGDKPPLLGSADPAFRGDAERYNPEDLMVAAISSCHMLWYLHLCATNGIVITAYRDQAAGVMDMNPDGSGQFTSVTLHPTVTITDAGLADKARALHEEAHKMCFVARSVNFPIAHEAEIVTA